jgi:hypothetical protein
METTTREDLQDRFLPTAIYAHRVADLGRMVVFGQTLCGFHAVEACLDEGTNPMEWLAAPLGSACDECGGTLESLNA